MVLHADWNMRASQRYIENIREFESVVIYLLRVARQAPQKIAQDSTRRNKQTKSANAPTTADRLKTGSVWTCSSTIGQAGSVQEIRKS
jgi:hypothetical protein